MGLNRLEVLNCINRSSVEKNTQDLINLLCDIFDDKDFFCENYDLALIIMNITELYGYREYFENLLHLNADELSIGNFSQILRRDTYKSKINPNLYFNSGQLSLLQEIETNHKVFISAPTSFGKTSLLFEYIAINNSSIDKILFIAPTNSLIEELYIKFLKLNLEVRMGYQISTNPGKKFDRGIWILTPEKLLLMLESKIVNFNLMIMDESYKIENEINYDESDVLNSRSSKYRKVMEYLGKSNAKTIFLSPYTYNKDDSMKRFLIKYDIAEIDRRYNYVEKSVVDISNQTKHHHHFGDSSIRYNSTASGLEKARKTLPLLNESTIIYIRYPRDAKDLIANIENNDIDICDERYKKFLSHLQENYIFDNSTWYVIDSLKKGIGVYVSPIPRYIKREIIDLFNRNIIKTLVVTTAFAEGVNSSAKNILITNSTAGANTKLTDLEILNLCGRAGRFGKHSKGIIYTTKEEVATIFKNSSERGVVIKNPNYFKNDSNSARSLYDIEIIDVENLSDEEINIKKEVLKLQEALNLSDEDLDISLGVSNLVKIKMYLYFTQNSDVAINLDRYDKVKNLLSSDKKNVVESIENIFKEIKSANIKVSKSQGDIPPYNKNDDFIWGKFYAIHSSGDIKAVLKNRKNYISKIIDETFKNINKELLTEDLKKSKLISAGKEWIVDNYMTNGDIDDFKLYNTAFKFITNIIEYRIPFYVGMYVSVFKLYCKKNNLDYEFNFDVVDISNSLENKQLNDKYLNMLEFGFSLDLIKKIEKNNNSEKYEDYLDKYEILMLDEYNSIFN